MVNKYFNVELSIPGVNGGSSYSPLYYASCLCENELKELVPPLYNTNQESQFINKKFGWFILTNKWEPTQQELDYERQLMARRLSGLGSNGRQTRRGLCDAYTEGLNKPESR